MWSLWTLSPGQGKKSRARPEGWEVVTPEADRVT